MGWGYQEELLANIVETVDLGNRLFHQANSKKGTAKPEPVKIPRPHRQTTKRPATKDDLRQIFGAAPVRRVSKE